VLDDRILLVTPPGMAQKALEALDHYLFSEKVTLRDASEETALFLLVGPETLATVEWLAGARPGDAAWSHVAATLAGVAVRLVGGAGETGGPEVWVAAARADGARVREALVASGARSLGPTAFESLRVEAGTPLFGHDVDPSVLLPEIPFEKLVSHTKGCYPGQEVVVRIRDRGHVNRRFCGLVLEGDTVPPRGAGVVVDGADVGKVTSATWSFGLSRPIALAFVRRQHAEAGTAVTVRAGERTIQARVSDLPFAR
jgi:folate-binding protein YgfZ